MKWRRSPSVLMVPHHGFHRAADRISVDHKGDYVLIDAKAGSGKTALWAQAATKGKFYGGGYPKRIFVEGDSDQAIFNFIDGDPPYSRNVRHFLQKPPKTAGLLLSFIPVKYRDNLLGDLEEDYWTRLVPKHGLRWARVCYWFQAIYALSAFLARAKRCR
jgi:hypothetical protein